MPQFKDASPEISVHLYKTISRKTVDGQSAVSTRYQGKGDYINLTEYLGDNSAVRTTKSVREPAGGFNITFGDKARGAAQNLESVYGLIEPMDGIEIRMWGGTGPRPNPLPIVMRGFVSSVQRSQSMGDNGKPLRTVSVTGQDYGKIWQMYQIIYLRAYAEAKSLLSTYALWEKFGLKAQNTMKASQLVQDAVDKLLNPFLAGFLPEHWSTAGMPTAMKTDITVTHGTMGNSYQNAQGSIFDILRANTDVPTWNELYTEDRDDGVFVVYRPIPALKLTQGKDDKNRKIQQDAPDPIYVQIEDGDIEGISVERSDAGVANFYWVSNTMYDLIDEMQRKQMSIQRGDKSVSRDDYPNSNAKYYGVRPMYAETHLAADEVTNIGPGQSKDDIDKNNTHVEAWIDKRRRELAEMNQDNVVLEHGMARVKGGQMRQDGKELMKAGDYGRFLMGQMEYDAYCIQIDHEFVPYSGYTSTLVLDRGEGFVKRVIAQNGAWLTEQASRS